jgi:hypothetical protein
MFFCSGDFSRRTNNQVQVYRLMGFSATKVAAVW